MPYAVTVDFFSTPLNSHAACAIDLRVKLANELIEEGEVTEAAGTARFHLRTCPDLSIASPVRAGAFRPPPPACTPTRRQMATSICSIFPNSRFF